MIISLNQSLRHVPESLSRNMKFSSLFLRFPPSSLAHSTVHSLPPRPIPAAIRLTRRINVFQLRPLPLISRPFVASYSSLPSSTATPPSSSSPNKALLSSELLPPLSTIHLLEVQGMRCGGCAANVKRTLAARPEIASVSVSLLTNTVAVSFRDPKTCKLDPILDLLASKGFASKPRSVPNSGGGAGGQGRGEGNLTFLTEIQDSAMISRRQASFDAWTAGFISLLCLLPHLNHLNHLDPLFGSGSNSLGSNLSALLSVIGEAVASPLGVGTIVLATAIGPGKRIIMDGVRSLMYGRPNMNSTLTFGLLASLLSGPILTLMSEGPPSPLAVEPLMLLAVVLMGRAAEARAKASATSDLLNLAKLLPSSARLILDSKSKTLTSQLPVAIQSFSSSPLTPPPLLPSPSPSSPSPTTTPSVDCLDISLTAVQPGDVVRVLPGEKFPVDGTVVAGSTFADEALLTGESLPVPKQPGSNITGGSLCTTGVVHIQATRTAEGSRVASIASLVLRAQQSETKIQRIADRVAGQFCLGVMAASIATFLYWSLVAAAAPPPPLLSSSLSASALSPTALALRLAADVAVVACPCAMGLAAPLAALVSSSLAARQGLLLRGGGAALEALATADVVVFDKTGTLTVGRPKVVGVNLWGDDVVQKDGSQIVDGDTFGSTNSSLASMNKYNSIKSSEIDDTLSYILATAAAVEMGSTHPLSAAIVAAAKENPGAKDLLNAWSTDSRTTSKRDDSDGVFNKVTRTDNVPGKGVMAVFQDGEIAAVGKLEWVKAVLALGGGGAEVEGRGDGEGTNGENKNGEEFKKRSRSLSLDADDVPATRPSSSGTSVACTTVYVGRSSSKMTINGSNGIIGSISLEDALRPEATDVIAWLRNSVGIQPESGERFRQVLAKSPEVYLISGDNEGTCRAVSEAVGIDPANVRHGASPEQKLAMIRELQGLSAGRGEEEERGGGRKGGGETHNNRKTVIMVGDGVNDAPALAAADAGVSFRSALDAAGCAASVILMKDHLSQLPEALLLGRATVNRIRLCLSLAVLYNAVGIPIAAGALLPSYGVMLSPATAAAAMSMSSVTVVLTALTLRMADTKWRK